MSISYTYQVMSVNKDGNCMDVLFKSMGLPDVTVGVRLPFEGENVEDVIRSFAPAIVWQAKTKLVQDVQVGLTGRVDVESEEEALNNARMWAQVDFEQNVAKVLLKFGVLDVDPTAIPVTGL